MTDIWAEDKAYPVRQISNYALDRTFNGGETITFATPSLVFDRDGMYEPCNNRFCFYYEDHTMRFHAFEPQKSELILWAGLLPEDLKLLHSAGLVRHKPLPRPTVWSETPTFVRFYFWTCVLILTSFITLVILNAEGIV